MGQLTFCLRRQLSGQRDSLRTIDIGAHIRTHHLRPHYRFSSCIRLSNLCNWVSQSLSHPHPHFSPPLSLWLKKKILNSYMNGSILIVTLQPTFIILHTLSSQRSPSPIVNMAWHASSSKQKSDMLATQTADGDLRVWSVAKPVTAETPKTIRQLKRGDNVESGFNWFAWSKNGRILQFSEGYVFVDQAKPGLNEVEGGKDTRVEAGKGEEKTGGDPIRPQANQGLIL